MIPHLYVLAGSCFPDCHPPPGSGWDPNGASPAMLGGLVVLVLAFALLSRRGGGR